ncbi:tRNA (adenosine(37)-N6)-dimethylallyltransferase MiaA [Youngiibacter multivorans]|uniref:tRNA dimethylallyltransferase n=1 Tax=Youngiibacter multivorans TaxID=937251 RepID=A0ABS4G2F6_9CLOT|nr:tRNA (adenosine(37)-N6)-dimethylallyltransferase MiaA [Youngiibacter multivorans]MBP1918731.1 tRNA dimethylallyltransferase [Youngiibacter multivorans]
MKPRLIIIAGPTGVGKTEISIRLAKLLDGEIVSCDSMQVYRLMDIGSAKATREEMQGIPHHMVDILDPMTPFTVSEYKAMAETAIDDIISRGKVPIMVGGTGLYIDSVITDMSFAEGSGDTAFRDSMEELAVKSGKEEVHRQLQEVDPIAAERIHPNNLKRVIRALEVYHMTGKPFSSFADEGIINPKYEVSYYYLNRKREELYSAIDIRVLKMLEEGLVDEVRMLRERGLTREHQSMQGIGYKEVLDYLDGKKTYDEMVEEIQRHSRNYAKRQLTWFRRKSLAVEIYRDAMSTEEILNLIKSMES